MSEMKTSNEKGKIKSNFQERLQEEITKIQSNMHDFGLGFLSHSFVNFGIGKLLASFFGRFENDLYILIHDLSVMSVILQGFDQFLG